MPRKAIIIGAGPAGLTAAYELLTRTDIVPVVLEMTGDIGGISKTVNYKGNRIDIGGHRFFSKSDRVMDWWLKILPLEPEASKGTTISYQRQSRSILREDLFGKERKNEYPDNVMLVRRRLSRIYFLRKFFSYPIQMSFDTLRKLGIGQTIGIVSSYFWARLFQQKPEKNLEQFFINRFGNKLYRLFFKDYTEKVWGVSCKDISAEWGAQRIKGISIGKAIAHAARSLRPKKKAGATDISQKDTETSLIEKFLYPKFGPGQLWEEVAGKIVQMGGTILLYKRVKSVGTRGLQVISIDTVDSKTGENQTYEGDYFFSTMPVKELIEGMGNCVPHNVQAISTGLQYRDFITVGVLLKKLSLTNEKEKDSNQRILPDTWIYIQEKDVKVGRIQIFNNWSPFMVKDPETVWIGLEYFCNTTDEFWKKSDNAISETAISELAKMGLAKPHDVLDSTVLRMEKTYPAYFGTYSRFEEVRDFTDQFGNLFLVGRNGMHKYNNSDHSMLTAMVAVDNIKAGVTSKANIWAINTEHEYHEEKTISKVSPIVNPARTRSFGDFLSMERGNKALLWLAAAAILLQFIIFKYFYPQAGFINADSYNYLDTAKSNLSINVYPVGYPNFLRLFSVFTNSDTALVAFQYLLLQCSSLFLLFTISFFYHPGKWAFNIAYVFILFNPVWLYLANYVSSDALFVGLSIVWFTMLIWLTERPNNKLLIGQVGLLFFLFTVRYNAMYYPVITSIALILARKNWKWKVLGIVASFLVIFAFMWNTTNRYQEQTGVRTFSPFTGWQLANNALYSYRYVDSASRKQAPKELAAVDAYVRHYFDTSRDVRTHPLEAVQANTVYMWDSRSPLRKYMVSQFLKDSTSSSLKQWASVSPLYAKYGSWLIKTYPKEYALYYLWPNTLKYYAPQVEFLDTYNMGEDTVAKIARSWFHYTHRHVKFRTKSQNVGILDFYPILAGALNVVFMFGFITFCWMKGFRTRRYLSKAVILIGAFWLFNFGFSVLASPVALRFQLFPVLVSFVFALIFLEYLVKMAFESKPEPTAQPGAPNLA